MLQIKLLTYIKAIKFWILVSHPEILKITSHLGNMAELSIGFM